MNLYLVFYNTGTDVISRYTSYCYYKIGDYNGFNWKIVDILILHEGKFISVEKYRSLRKNNKKNKDSKLSRILKIVFEK